MQVARGNYKKKKDHIVAYTAVLFSIILKELIKTPFNSNVSGGDFIFFCFKN